MVFNNQMEEGNDNYHDTVDDDGEDVGGDGTDDALNKMIPCMLHAMADLPRF